MPDPVADPAAGLAPPIAPDPSALQWPWGNGTVDPFAQGATPASSPDAPAPNGVQPGLGGVPASALDAAVPPSPALGPPPGDVAPLDIPPAPSPDAPAPLPWGAAGPTPAGEQGPAAPGVGPAAPGTVAEQPGISITTEQSPTQAQQDAAAFVADPTSLDKDLLSRSRLSDEEAGQIYANLPPDQRAGMKAQLDAAKANDYATQILQTSTDNKIRAQRNADAYDKGMAAAQQAQTDLMTDAKALASQKVDPDRWWNSRSAPQKVAGYIAAITGGLVQGRSGGPNIGLQGIQKAIDDDIEAQKTDLSNQRASISTRQGIVGQMFAQTGDMYRAQETARAAMWESTVQELQTKQQLYDPRGTTAMRIGDAIAGARAQQATIAHAIGQQAFKDHVETYKLGQEDTKQAETERHNRVDEENSEFKIAAKYGGLGAGAGAGGSTNPNYNVATGFFDPFTNEPIFGKRQIGGKGEDPKERNTVSAQISTYKHVQDYWAKLHAIGARINYQKSLGEKAWGARKSTLGAEYDAAREALTVYLTKELGDKLTQGQLEAQQHRIPERASVFDARDPSKQLTDAQEDADRDFLGDMNLVGVNAAPIVKHAQEARAAAPPPSADDAIYAAQQAQAQAQTPSEQRDAAQQAEAVHQRLVKEEAGHRDEASAIDFVSKLGAFRRYDNVNGLPPELAATLRERNEAVDTYDQLLAKAHAKPTDGTAAKAARDAFRTANGIHAKTFDGIADALTQDNFGGIAHDRATAVVKYLGFDPDTVAAHDMTAGVPLRFSGGQSSTGQQRDELAKKIRNLPAGQQSHVLQLLSPSVAGPQPRKK